MDGHGRYGADVVGRKIAAPDCYRALKSGAETSKHLYSLDKMVDDTERLYRALAGSL